MLYINKNERTFLIPGKILTPPILRFFAFIAAVFAADVDICTLLLDAPSVVSFNCSSSSPEFAIIPSLLAVLVLFAVCACFVLRIIDVLRVPIAIYI